MIRPILGNWYLIFQPGHLIRACDLGYSILGIWSGQMVHVLAGGSNNPHQLIDTPTEPVALLRSWSMTHKGLKCEFTYQKNISRTNPISSTICSYTCCSYFIIFSEQIHSPRIILRMKFNISCNSQCNPWFVSFLEYFDLYIIHIYIHIIILIHNRTTFKMREKENVWMIL